MLLCIADEALQQSSADGQSGGNGNNVAGAVRRIHSPEYQKNNCEPLAVFTMLYCVGFVLYNFHRLTALSGHLCEVVSDHVVVLQAEKGSNGGTGGTLIQGQMIDQSGASNLGIHPHSSEKFISHHRDICLNHCHS